MQALTRRDAVKAATAAAGLAAVGGTFALAQEKEELKKQASKPPRDAERQWTFEEINQHVEQAQLPSEAEVQRLRTASRADLIEQLCPIYKTIRPILQALSSDGFPFIPEKWKRAIKVFIGLMDILCP